jgi:tRNA modification GTPase
MGADRQAAAADEVVLAVKRAGPVPWVEVHCHGGREVVGFLLEALERHGARTCSWQELERLTGGGSGRGEALAALTQAWTARTAAILLDQYQGAFSRAAGAVRAALAGGDLAEASRLLNDLARHAGLGRHLTAPWRVAVAGAPNVGKSSLVNALAGFQRSVVAATPGTTRDVVTTAIAVDGWPVELADTAGLRQAEEALEHAGIDRAQAAAEQADLCLWVLDASAPSVWPAVQPKSLRLVVNKVDLPAAWDLTRAAGALRVSALTGAGLGDLCQALAGWLVPDPPAPGVVVPFTPSLADRVEEAQRLCSAGQVAEAARVLNDITFA